MTAVRARTGVTTPVVPHTVALLPVGPGLWRVVDRSGRAVGHLAERSIHAGGGWEARRFHVPSRSFRQIGIFWSAAEAVECLRLSR
ncbi:hypothetical protein [Microbacterium invictum]|uniref:Uncharacterized protein n=1 Tax=Microbacterium invictum TaxID=515415 RepID=A0AA40SMR5_9MICO|nr:MULTISPECIES: hypothetical protein [Microbacterium]MBB4138999.1 hypothetical protein [Microbacterium invictum]